MTGGENVYKYITTEGKVTGKKAGKITALEYLQKSTGVFIAEQSGEKETAKRFVRELETECYTLGEFPNSGANPDDRLLVSMGYKFLIHKDYLIFYTVDETNNIVYIQAIFNAKKDYTKYMRKLIRKSIQ